MRAVPVLAGLTFLAVLFVGLLAVGQQRLALSTTSTYLRVRLGDDILRDRQLPQADAYSYTRAGAPYVDYGWGFDVVISRLARLFASDGIVLFSAVAWGLIAALIMARMLRRRVRLPVALVCLASAWMCARFFYAPEPHTISFIGCAIGLELFERGAWNPRRASTLAWTLAFFTLWTCFHPGSLLFIVVLAVELGVLAWPRGRFDGKAAGWGALVVAVAALGTCLTPYGLRLPATALALAFQPLIPALVDAYQPPPVSVEYGIALLVFAIGAAFSVLAALPRRPRVGEAPIPRPRPRAGELLTFALLGTLTSQSREFSTYLVVCCTPMLAIWPTALWPKLPPEVPKPQDLQASPTPQAKTNALRALVAALGGLAVLAIGGLAFLAANPGRLSLPTFTSSSRLPFAATRFIARNPALFGSRLFADAELGSFIDFALPERKVFIDDRPELYGGRILLNVKEVSRGMVDVASFFKSGKIETVLARFGSALDIKLSLPAFQLAGFKRVYADNIATIHTYTPPAPEASHHHH